MPRIGGLGRIIIAVVVFLSLVIVGITVFPVPKPHIALPAEAPFSRADVVSIDASSDEISLAQNLTGDERFLILVEADPDGSLHGEELLHVKTDGIADSTNSVSVENADLTGDETLILYITFDPDLSGGWLHAITNTLLATWLSMIILVGLFYLGTRKMKLVPTGLQNLTEMIVETLFNFVVGIAGENHGRKFFPVIATIFLFVIVNAWLPMVPGFHTIGFGQTASYEGAFTGTWDGFVVYNPILRKAPTDANFPLAIALVSGIFGWFWGIRLGGFKHFMGEYVRLGGMVGSIKLLFKGNIGGALGGILPGFIDAFIGFIEFLSHMIRVVSFTFRLFGNMVAGEVLILMMALLIPWGVVPIFFGLELILGFVQALIFAGLTLVWTSMAASHRDANH